MRLIGLLAACGCLAANGQIYQQLYAFHGGSDGYGPEGGLVQGIDGGFYGTTAYGGQPTTNCPTCGYGTVFKVTRDGDFNTVALFTDQYNGYPFGQMVQATDGNFYGTTEYIFKVTPTGTLTTIRGAGLEPTGDPVQGGDGYIYGADAYSQGVYWTSLAGSTGGSVSAQGQPSGGLTQARDGNLYGLTDSGGMFGMGTAYTLTTNGVLTTLASFGPYSNSNAPFYPYDRMLQASDGKLYGVSDSESGQVFKLETNGALNIFAKFGLTDVGRNPNGGLVEANDGNFYGTTFEGGGVPGAQGTVFKLTPEGHISTLVSFTYRSNYPGSGPMGGLVQGTDGNLYGTCAYGGEYGGGNVFRLIMPGPRLNLLRSEEKLVLSWRTNYTGYKIQSCSNLLAGNWLDLTNSVRADSGQFFVTNSLNPGIGFFRLVKW
jgi:uncharacterized repeat protein (TIGR03803 family)